jgi:hypothetical protein
VCAFAQVDEVNVLLASGTSIRKVARMFALARTTVARHREHVPELDKPLGLIRTEGGPQGSVDPLEAAYELAGQARSERERYKALEAIRSATALLLRGAKGEPDEQTLEQVERNVQEAEAQYLHGSGSFENTSRALAGLREAHRQRLDAIRAPGSIEVPVTITTSDGTPLAGSRGVWSAAEALYWAGVPARFRDPNRYVVHRRITLRLGGAPNDEELLMSSAVTSPVEEIKVFEKERDVLAWSGDR